MSVALTAVCVRCGDCITNDIREDNRYRGCEVCGWLMHDGCWNEALAFGELNSGDFCPVEIRPYEWVKLVEVGGLTPTGKPKRRRQTVVIADPEIVDGHMDVMGMHGEWGPLDGGSSPLG